LRGSKGQLYEGGIRSPLIVWAPKLIAGDSIGASNNRTVMAGIDLAPSVLGLTGVAAPASVSFDGVDMCSTMMGKAASQRPKPVMWVRPPDRPGPRNEWPDLAVRQGQWKLLTKRDGSNVELFDVFADPTESKNLAQQNPDVAQRLKQEVIAWDKSIQ
jgi:arylsulfatase A-like enzyme